MERDDAALWLGEELNEHGERAGARVEIEPGDLTTHGVIVGMTGSGKTGLGIVLLEEALLRGIPALILDPKGDMGNLLLNFPGLQAADFAPWVEAGAGESVDAAAQEVAAGWKQGLDSWQIDGARMRTLGLNAAFTIYTPGSESGVPLNLLGSLQRPAHADQEAIADEIEAFVSGLLTLVDRPADPIAGREHILLSSLISRAWQAREPLDLAGLIGQVATPPIRKLGVFELDTFFPAAERMQLAVQLNALLAAPAFATWMSGAPIDLDALLRDAQGRPRAAIVHLAHLSDTERQFVVTLVLSRLVSWMRRQPGTSDLRALVYMDEIFGFAPPSANPPSKKPILTILKQARAHGVGLVVATQNPVDLDYKAMANAGTWMIGRLQTERDKDRILEGMRAAGGGTDAAALGAAIGNLGKRQFLLHTTRGGPPRYFTTRWSMSYLRGPLTRTEIERLMRDVPERNTPADAAATAASADPGGASAAGADETAIAPVPPRNVLVRHLDAAAPWAQSVGALAGGRRLQAAIAARAQLRYDDRAAGVDHVETWECVWYPLTKHLRAEDALAVDYDDRDLRATPPADSVYVLPDADISDAALYRALERELREHLYRNRRIEVLHNAGLDLFSRPDEDAAAFAERCRTAAAQHADREAAALRDRFEERLDRLEQRRRDAERRVEELAVDARSRSQHELVAGAGALLSMFLGGRRGTRGLSGIASRRSTTRRTQERLETARQKAGDFETELADIEQDLADELVRIQEKWDRAAADSTTRSIPLDKTDIDVDEMVLLWVPT